MKILVCISHVPDTTSKINFVNGDSEFDTNGVQYVINPNDEFGLTRAIWFQEQQGATVTVVNVGGPGTEPTLRKALAIGANEAIRVNANPTDGFFVANCGVGHHDYADNQDQNETADYACCDVEVTSVHGFSPEWCMYGWI